MALINLMSLCYESSQDTLIDDVDKLISFVRRYNNSIPEYIRVARMYFFGTPIRRTGSGFRRATPGCIRLKRLHENSDDEDSDDEIDVPLSPDGDLDLHRVKLWWGIRTCQPLEPSSWKVFHPRDHKTISGAAVHNLTNGRQNMFLIFFPKAMGEDKLEELGTWAHELKWQRRALADDPAWYINRLVSLCALAWLVSLIPGTLALALSAVVRWAHGLLMALPEHARTRSF